MTVIMYCISNEYLLEYLSLCIFSDNIKYYPIPNYRSFKLICIYMERNIIIMKQPMLALII